MRLRQKLGAMARIAPFAYVLAVRDMRRTAAYFRDALGFQVKWMDAADWRIVERDGVRIMLGHCPNAAPAADLGDHTWFGYLHVDDVDALYDEIAPLGAIVREAPSDKPWGMREMLVATPDGHRLMFGQEIAGLA